MLLNNDLRKHTVAEVPLSEGSDRLRKSFQPVGLRVVLLIVIVLLKVLR